MAEMPTVDVCAPECNPQKGEDNYQAWFANQKRTYDEYQQVSLEGIKLQQQYIQKILSDANQHDNQRQVVANQALQNAVETANMVGKQAVRHGDLSIDRQWNLEVSEGASQSHVLSEPYLSAIKAAVAAAVAETVSKK